MRINRFIGHATTAFAFSLSAAAQDQPLADKVATQLQQALPGYDVLIADPLTLKLGPHGHADFQLNLDRMSRFCAQNPNDCEDEISGFVAKVVPVVKAQAVPLRIDDLRAVVRPTAYVEAMKQQLRSQDVSFVTAPMAGDLTLFCYFDSPTAMRPATTQDVAPLGLSSEQAIERCEKNVRLALPPLEAAIAKQPEGFGGLLNGDPYESSYFIFHDDWGALAAKFGGHLIVAVPDASVVIYAKDDGSQARERLSDAAKQLLNKAERPLSADVFVWTQNGWDVAAP